MLLRLSIDVALVVVCSLLSCSCGTLFPHEKHLPHPLSSIPKASELSHLGQGRPV